LTASTPTVPILIVVFAVFVSSAFDFSELSTITREINEANITIRRIINLDLAIITFGK
jgi:hypothetical protein